MRNCSRGSINMLVSNQMHDEELLSVCHTPTDGDRDDLSKRTKSKSV